MAVATLDAAHSCARKGVDPEVSMPCGRPPCHRRAQPGTPGVGQLLPHRKCRAAVQPDRHVRVEETRVVARATQGSSSPPGRVEALDARNLLEPRTAPPAWDHPLSGATLLETGVRVML